MCSRMQGCVACLLEGFFGQLLLFPSMPGGGYDDVTGKDFQFESLRYVVGIARAGQPASDPTTRVDGSYARSATAHTA